MALCLFEFIHGSERQDFLEGISFFWGGCSGEGEKAQPQAVENARSSSSGKEKEVQQSSL